LGRSDPSAKRLRSRTAFCRAPVHISLCSLPTPNPRGSLRELSSPRHAHDGEKA